MKKFPTFSLTRSACPFLSTERDRNQSVFDLIRGHFDSSRCEKARVNLMAFITSSSPGQQQQQEEEEEEETKQSHLLPLLISETSPNLMMCPSITTVRFYESKDGTGTDFEGAVADLHMRVNECV